MTTQTTETIDVTDIAGFIEAYRIVDAKIKEYAEMRESLRKRIEETMGQNDLGTVHGRPVVRWTRFTVRRMNTKLVAERFGPEQLSDCYIESESSRFSVLAKLDPDLP